MALQPRRFFIDVESRQFVSTPTSNLPAFDPTWIEEDVESVEIYALRPTNDPARPYAFVDLSGATVKFAVGTTTPAALQTAWTTLPTTVTVTNTETQEGGVFGGTIDEEQKLTWSGAQPSEGTYALAFPYRDVTYSTTNGSTVYQAEHHGLYNGRTVSISGQDFTVINSGQNSFSLAAIGSVTAITAGATGSGTLSVPTIITPAIAHNATVAQIQQAIVDAGFVLNGIPQVLVSGENGRELNIKFTGRSGRRSYSPVLVSNSSMKGAPGVSANVSYNTSEIAALVAAGTTSVTLEIEISEGAARQTFRRSAILSPDLITSTSPAPLPANVLNSFSMQSGDGSVFTFTVTNTGELMIAEQ
jgi:hypothetical protein